jgi:hypothetical protein
MHGAILLASENSPRTSFSPSPNHLLVISDIDTSACSGHQPHRSRTHASHALMNAAPASAATALASIVLPVPGGPNSRMPVTERRSCPCAHVVSRASHAHGKAGTHALEELGAAQRQHDQLAQGLLDGVQRADAAEPDVHVRGRDHALRNPAAPSQQRRQHRSYFHALLLKTVQIRPLQQQRALAGSGRRRQLFVHKSNCVLSCTSCVSAQRHQHG